MIYHTWFSRSKCSCGFLWTTSATDSVICKCGQTSITPEAISRESLEFTEQEFIEAVAQDIGELPENVQLVYGGA